MKTKEEREPKDDRYKLEYPLLRKYGKFYYKRVGKCNPKKCNSACCKVFTFGDAQGEYYRGFVNRIKAHKRKNGKREFSYFKKQCCFLKSNGKCSRWNTCLPIPCYQFPWFNDNTYKLVKSVCSIKWKKITKKEYLR